MKKFDLLIKSVRVFDPINHVDLYGDIGIMSGKISTIESNISADLTHSSHDFNHATAILRLS